MRSQHLRGIFRILHHEAFGQFELQSAGADTRAGQHRLDVMQEIVAEQLARGDIDACENRRFDVERALPGGELVRRALQREKAEIDDYSGFFGKRNEFAGAEPPMPRMIPSEQGLEARDRAVLEPDDRLKKDLDFAAVERPAQIGLETEAVRATDAHRRPEHFDPVAAHALAMPHRDFGVFQHVLARRVQLRVVERKADRGGERDFLVAERRPAWRRRGEPHWRAR